MKKYYILAASIAVLLIAGFLIPLGSYTTRQGCPVDPTPAKRLHLIAGDSLAAVERDDVAPAPNVGCSPNTRYILYML